jgi:hypothetical protein
MHETAGGEVTPMGLEHPPKPSGNRVVPSPTGAEYGAPDAPKPPRSLPDDPDLVAIAAAWPTLPGPVKAGIVAMVRAAGGTSGGGAA